MRSPQGGGAGRRTITRKHYGEISAQVINASAHTHGEIAVNFGASPRHPLEPEPPPGFQRQPWPRTPSQPIGLVDVEAAARRLVGVTHHTPVLTSRTLDAITGGRVCLKAECFQRGGAFKVRGAYNRIAALDPRVRAHGVVAWSSGNHAQAVAIVAELLGVPATIVMPIDAPPAKLAATRGYGAEIVAYDRYAEDREVIAVQLAADRGCALVPPYDDPYVMAGQGTSALELIKDVGELDVLLVPVGGGGLIAGSATAAKALLPRVRVVGVEPATGDDTKQSLAAGRRITIGVPRTIADGLQAVTPGALTFEVIQQLVDAIVVVTDDEILDAMVFAFDRLKIVTEPSGACALAALLTSKLDTTGKRVGVIISGGNVDFLQLCRWRQGRARPADAGG
jgi:threonine dehydratase